MAEVTVEQLAQVVKIPVDILLQQFRDAGLEKTSASDAVSDQEKVQLLTHLQSARSAPAAKKPAAPAAEAPAAAAQEAAPAAEPEAQAEDTDAAVDEPAKPAPRAPAKPPLRRTSTLTTRAGAGRSSSNVTVEVKRRRPRRPVAPSEPEIEEVTELEDTDADMAAVNEASDPVTETDVDNTDLAFDDTALDVDAADDASNADDSDALVAPDNSAIDAANAVEEEVAAAAAAAAAAEAAAREEAASAAVAVTTPEPADETPAAELNPEQLAQLELQRKANASRELEQRRLDAVAQQKGVDTARAEAEQQAIRQVARERRRVADEQLTKEREERKKVREAEDAQRRAALEAQEAAREKSKGANNAGGGGGGGRGGRGGGRGRPGGAGGGGGYGRNQLHVAKGKSGKRKSKGRRTVAANIESKHTFEMPTEPVVRDVQVPETITVAALADRMAVKAAEVIKAMMSMGVMATINQMLDQDTAILVVEEMGHVAIAQSDDIESLLAERLASVIEGDQETRPPVVTVMGHVDHGKTSLLDYIRESRVASGEAGGITQHIGAYHVETKGGVITFLDTPGHAAFSAMRARGAKATDIVVLVVAGDDGVMPQTIEGVQHARAAGVPLVVAVNKMDKEGADAERIKNELSAHDVIPEDWGGDTPYVPVSALEGTGIENLLETLSLQAEVLELKASTDVSASGIVIEATLDRGRGPVATVLVQNGTLKRGDSLICGQETGRVRALFDESGNQVESAGPSIPVQLLGLSGTPNAGDEMLVAADERGARELAELRQGKERDLRLAGTRPAKMEDVFSQIKSGEVPMLNLVVKADVKGSFEAIRQSLEEMSTDEVGIRVVGGGVGGITESDANLAAASNAILIGFNTRADGTARKLIAEHDIELRYYSVIYELIDLVKQVAGGMLAPEVRENIIGLAEVKDVFRSPKFGQIAGCMVIDGVVRREEPIRVLRDSVVIFEGELDSLRRFKEDVNDVNMGTECGIGVKNYTDVKPGDQIEVFERTEVARTL